MTSVIIIRLRNCRTDVILFYMHCADFMMVNEQFISISISISIFIFTLVYYTEHTSCIKYFQIHSN